MSKRQFKRVYLEILLFVVLVGLFIRAFLFTTFYISGEQMSPALRSGQVILVSRSAYGLKLPLTQTRFLEKGPRRGEVVVYVCGSRGEEVCLSRVIGLEGDRVRIDERGRLNLNDQDCLYRPKEENSGTYFEQCLSELEVVMRPFENGLRSDFVVEPRRVLVRKDRFQGPGKNSEEFSFQVIARGDLIGRAEFLFFRLKNEAGEFGIDFSESFRSL